MRMKSWLRSVKQQLEWLQHATEEQRIEAINEIKLVLHEYSPFKNEPVDCVVWVHHKSVEANDYNPNTVAPPEMELLERSVAEDGYTQPIVSWRIEDKYEVVDGFHRNLVGQESKTVQHRSHAYETYVKRMKKKQKEWKLDDNGQGTLF